MTSSGVGVTAQRRPPRCCRRPASRSASPTSCVPLGAAVRATIREAAVRRASRRSRHLRGSSEGSLIGSVERVASSSSIVTFTARSTKLRLLGLQRRLRSDPIGGLDEALSITRRRGIATCSNSSRPQGSSRSRRGVSRPCVQKLDRAAAEMWRERSSSSAPQRPPQQPSRRPADV